MTLKLTTGEAECIIEGLVLLRAKFQRAENLAGSNAASDILNRVSISLADEIQDSAALLSRREPTPEERAYGLSLEDLATKHLREQR